MIYKRWSHQTWVRAIKKPEPKGYKSGKTAENWKGVDFVLTENFHFILTC